MTRIGFRSAAAQILLQAAALTAVFGGGIAAGLYCYPLVHSEHREDEPHHDEHDDEHGEDEDEHDEDAEPHVALTKAAFANLDLQLGPVTTQDYWKSILVPAHIVEIPGRSDLTVSAPVAGLVDEVFVLPGESIRTDQPLFQIRLTDESLINTQSQLLASLKRKEVARAEIDRLTPLIASGAVSGGKKRELAYELEQIEAEQGTLQQELFSRGLPTPLIEQLITQRQLVSTITIRTPTAYVPATSTAPDSLTGYSVEQLKIHPGQAVARGDELCNVAFHEKLYVEGTAFEEDLPVLQNIAEQGWAVVVESHHALADTHHSDAMHPELKLLRVDNHVDEDTQTLRFYLELTNQITRQFRDGERLYAEWKFRPGQRLHLKLPVEKWRDQIVLPAAAVVIEGPNAYVFAEHHDDHLEHDDHGQDKHGPDQDTVADVVIELEPIPVRVLHRDERVVVIGNDDQFAAETRIAINRARQLYLALQMQQSGGGGHDHGHDH